jgi:hypothetical protein
MTQPVPHNTEICIRWYPNIDDVKAVTCRDCAVYGNKCDHKINVDEIDGDDIVDATMFTMEPTVMPELHWHQCDYIEDIVEVE